jgi:hypothetical protein
MQRHEAPRSGAPNASPFGSPAIGLSNHRIIASRHVAACTSPNRNRTLVTAFRSPATAAHSRASIPGSKFPTCYFTSLLASRSARSALPLHRLYRFAPVQAVSTLRARYRTARQLHRLLSRFPLPFGILTSRRIKSVPPGSLPPGPPSESARFPLAPRRRFLLLVWSTDHRSWSATFPEARCSSNLLEPISLCSRSHPASTRLLVFPPGFQQDLFIVFAYCYRSVTVDYLWIKRVATVLFCPQRASESCHYRWPSRCSGCPRRKAGCGSPPRGSPPAFRSIPTRRNPCWSEPALFQG